MALAMEWPSAVDGVAVGFRASGAFLAFVRFWPNCCYNKPFGVSGGQGDTERGQHVLYIDYDILMLSLESFALSV